MSSRHAAASQTQTEGCVHCNICSAHCPTGAIDFKNAEIYNESECIKCFACSQECPVDANFFTFKIPLPVATADYAPVSLERRTFMATGAMALMAAPVLNAAAGEPKSQKKLIRPPMSREERDFLSSCIRCGECMKACPTGVLKPAGLEYGMRALWSPVLTPSEGYCEKGCNACSQACPTDAIMKYPIENKYDYKAGTAVFNVLPLHQRHGKQILLRMRPRLPHRRDRDHQRAGSRKTRRTRAISRAGRSEAHPPRAREFRSMRGLRRLRVCMQPDRLRRTGDDHRLHLEEQYQRI